MKKVGWILTIVIALEIEDGYAVREYFEAREDLEIIKEKFPDVKIGLGHAFYARMGGFAAFLRSSQGSLRKMPAIRGLFKTQLDELPEPNFDDPP